MLKNKDKDDPKPLSRRAFARGVAIAAAGAVVLPGGSEAQQAPPPSSSAPVVTPEKKPAEASIADQKMSPAEEAELDAKFNRIVNVYGPRLSPQQKAEVRRQLGDQVKALGSIRGAAIDNSVQPATVLKVTGKA